MNLKVNIRIKLHIQLKAREKLIAAALGSCRKISDTTMNGIGPEKEKVRISMKDNHYENRPIQIY